MKHRDLHLLEKIQVQLATVVMVCVVYFGLWPALRPGGPQDPACFLATGGPGTVAGLAAALWALAALGALVTIHARPEGTVLAALFGAAGVSLRSPKIRALLWARQDNLSGLYAQLILEVLILAAAVIVATVVVGLARAVVARFKPGWLWRSPLIEQSPELRKDAQEIAAGKAGHDKFMLVVFGPSYLFARALLQRVARMPGPEGAGRGKDAPALGQCLKFLGLGLIVAVVLLLLLMRSAERGQILFALVASFTVAALVAHQAFGTRYSLIALLMPILAAVGFYALAAATVIDQAPLAWTEVPFYARALPIDWATAGCGGALLGFWTSARIQEMRHVSTGQQNQERQN